MGDPTPPGPKDIWDAGYQAGWDAATEAAQARFQQIFDLGLRLGQRESDQILTEAAQAFIAEAQPLRTWEIRLAREASDRRAAQDCRTGEQLRAEAEASWAPLGLACDQPPTPAWGFETPTEHRESAARAARHRITVRVDDDCDVDEL